MLTVLPPASGSTLLRRPPAREAVKEELVAGGDDEDAAVLAEDAVARPAGPGAVDRLELPRHVGLDVGRRATTARPGRAARRRRCRPRTKRISASLRRPISFASAASRCPRRRSPKAVSSASTARRATRRPGDLGEDAERTWSPSSARRCRTMPRPRRPTPPPPRA